MSLPRSLARFSNGNLGSIAVNVVVPFLIFVQASPALGQARALMIASVPPITWSAAELARSRRMDALSLLVIATLTLSIGALAGGGSARALQFRQHLVNAVLGVAFLVSAAVGRPLTHYVGQAQEARRTEQGRDARAVPDHAAMITTLIWGIGLAGQSAVGCCLVLTLPVRDVLLIGPVVGYSLLGCVALLATLYKRSRHPSPI